MNTLPSDVQAIIWKKVFSSVLKSLVVQGGFERYTVPSDRLFQLVLADYRQDEVNKKQIEKCGRTIMCPPKLGLKILTPNEPFNLFRMPSLHRLKPQHNLGFLCVELYD